MGKSGLYVYLPRKSLRRSAPVPVQRLYMAIYHKAGLLLHGENMADNMRAVIWCMGNPLIFIGGLACVIGLIGVRSEPKTKLTGIPFISIAALCQILPWILITREVFIYHYFSTIPFLILAITYFMRYICEKHGKKGKYFAIAFLAVSALLFILFYPPITGTPMNVWYARLIRWSPLWPISL